MVFLIAFTVGGFAIVIPLLCAVREQLNRIERSLGALRQQEAVMDQSILDALAELNTSVASDADVTSSAVTAISGLTAKIDQLLASSADPAEIVAAIKAANDAFKANTDTLAASVANIPPDHTA